MGQIISRKYAQTLIRRGVAWTEGIVRPDPSSDVRYVTVVRSDTQSIEHYRATSADLR